LLFSISFWKEDSFKDNLVATVAIYFKNNYVGVFLNNIEGFYDKLCYKHILKNSIFDKLWNWSSKLLKHIVHYLQFYCFKLTTDSHMAHHNFDCSQLVHKITITHQDNHHRNTTKLSKSIYLCCTASNQCMLRMIYWLACPGNEIVCTCDSVQSNLRLRQNAIFLPTKREARHVALLCTAACTTVVIVSGKKGECE